MRQVALVLFIDDGEEDIGGNDLLIGDTMVGHRPYDGSGRDEIASEIERAVAALLLPQLQKIHSRWSDHRPESAW